MLLIIKDFSQLRILVFIYISKLNGRNVLISILNTNIEIHDENSWNDRKLSKLHDT